MADTLYQLFGMAVAGAPPLPALFSALKEGGFDLDGLQVPAQGSPNLYWALGCGGTWKGAGSGSLRGPGASEKRCFSVRNHVLNAATETSNLRSLRKAQGDNAKQGDDTVAWDGVDLVSAPCLQDHAVTTYLEDGQRSIPIDGQQRQGGHGRRETAQIIVRPTTPPGLLVYQPCLR